MQTLIQIFVYLFQVLTGFYAAVAMLRVLLQLSRADYYNPISQFIVKATQPVVGPLRKLVPAWKTIDFAALLWCLLFQILAIEIACLVLAGSPINPLTALIWGSLGLLNLMMNIFFFGLLGLIIVSFIALLGGTYISHPALDLLRQLMAPVLAPFQKILPPMGGLDLSPIIVFLTINVLKIAISGMAGYVQLEHIVVPGI